ncbi:MAG: methyl-accepting chemotaxis protein [Brevinematales bacterium]|nr:methyl-accepting chemotaxis protein [Brevinematales bacterium]
MQGSHLVTLLQEIRKDCADVMYIYTMRQYEDKTIRFVVDADGYLEDGAKLGDVYEETTPLLVEATTSIPTAVVEEEFSVDEWGTFLSAYAPILTSDGKQDGIVGLDISLKTVQSYLSGLWIRMMVILFISSLLLIPAMILLFKDIVKPINVLMGNIQKLSEGDFSFSVNERFAKRHDEIGELFRAYDFFLKSARHMIGLIKKQARLLQEVGEGLALQMKETVKRTDTIVKSILNIKQHILTQSTSITATGEAIHHITEKIEVLDELIEKQATVVQTSVQAIAGVLHGIAEINETLRNNRHDMEKLKESSTTGKTALSHIMGEVKEVSRQSEHLLEVSQVIQDIATETNMLAINAALEAAHTGAAGKGFAVVADKVKRLAQSTGEKAKTVAHMIEKIKNSIDTITHLTEDALEKFLLMEQKVQKVGEQESSMAGIMEEQNLQNEKVLHILRELKEITEEVKAKSREMMQENNAIRQEATTLGGVTQETSLDMETMAKQTVDIFMAIEKANELTEENKERISSVISEVERFKEE